MEIKSDEFCRLSSSEIFLRWLRGIDEPLFDDLMEFLKRGESCSKNRQKMLELLNRLIKEKSKALALAAFIRQNFPGMIKTDDAKPSLDYNSLNIHRVFDYYDPTVATFPRRLIITSNEARGDLKNTVLRFCAKQHHCEQVILDDRAYIEYVPHNLASYTTSIPRDNWMVAKYKMTHDYQR